jgi:membrane associated rhomboid family serine protease
MDDNKPSLGNALRIACAFIAGLWLLKLGDVLFNWELFLLGVLPRTTDGLIGVLTAPLIHGSWQHLTGNTLPLLLLGSGVIYGYPKSRWWSLALIWLLSGLGVWLMARQNLHFGASGLTHGMFFFLLAAGLMRRDLQSMALLMIAFFMYSGMLFTIFPTEPGISFEYHLFGALSGIACAVLFRNSDRKPPVKRYAWQEQTDQDDPIIGDQWRLEGAQNSDYKKPR